MLKTKEHYIKELQKYPEDDAIYLIEKFNDNSGLFSMNKRFLYLVKTDEERINSVRTEYLNMMSNIEVLPVAKDSSFQLGKYNIIEFNGEFGDDVLNAFLELCYLHSQNIKDIKFADFFNSLVNMFQMPHEQQYKNLLGFYGEILFLVKCLSFGHNFVENWQVGGQSNCKYDLIFNDCNADIKTIVSRELVVTLKHRQLFNRDKTFLILMQLEKNNSGQTLQELLEILKKHEGIKYNYQFWVKVEKEKLKISRNDFEEERLSFKDCFIYESSVINPFPEIPLKVLEMNYEMDLLDEPCHSMTEFFCLVNE